MCKFRTGTLIFSNPNLGGILYALQENIDLYEQKLAILKQQNGIPMDTFFVLNTYFLYDVPKRHLNSACNSAITFHIFCTDSSIHTTL